MKPMVAAAAGALISGVAMYALGSHSNDVSAFSSTPALVQTAEGDYIAVNEPMRTITTLRPAAPSSTSGAVRRVSSRSAAPAARRTTARPSQVVDDRVYRDEREEPKRSWTKSALIIGGSAASGAGVGGVINGKKGALVGAAIGGGAASIYEATRRR